MRPFAHQWLAEFMRRNILLAVLVAVVAAGTAVWAFLGVQATVREARRNHLESLAAMQADMVRAWIVERQDDARTWADDPVVAALVAGLAGEPRPPAGSARARRLQGEFNKRLAPALEDHNLALANVVDADGVLVASMIPEYVGRKLKPEVWRKLARALGGDGAFAGPAFEADRLAGPHDAHADRALVWFAAPVRDPSGRVIAVLCLGRYASSRFAGMFEITRPGDTGEAYAFDAAGRMVSNSRFEPELHRRGLLGAGQAALGRLMLQPPAGAEAGGPTQLVAQALRAAAAGKDAGGVLLEPYRSYLGEPAIGAWRWLAAYDLGIAVEIGEAETYKPIFILDTHLLILMLTLAVALFLGPTLPAILWRRVVPVRSGQSVGAYRLERKIGEGGMADVFLGTHARLGRRAAVKVVKGGLREEMHRRFEREARLLASLRHPDIAAVFEIGNVEDGRPYYAMDYFEGEPLDRVVARDGPLDERRACRILIRVCGILQHVCDQGVVHRDAKPENLLLSADAAGEESVKLIDFGLAKSRDPADHDQLTQEVNLLGTLGYLAPERLRDPSDADIRGEVYAVGALGRFLLTGKEWAPSLEGAGREEAPPVGASRPLGTPGLEDAIARAMRRRKEARWADCREMAAALQACLDGASAASA